MISKQSWDIYTNKLYVEMLQWVLSWYMHKYREEFSFLIKIIILNGVNIFRRLVYFKLNEQNLILIKILPRKHRIFENFGFRYLIHSIVNIINISESTFNSYSF